MNGWIDGWNGMNEVWHRQRKLAGFFLIKTACCAIFEKQLKLMNKFTDKFRETVVKDSQRKLKLLEQLNT
jgi:hypothetical protein